MALTFITGNAGKFSTLQKYFPDIQQLDIDLDEIQEIDPQKVIAHKIHEALKHHDGEVIVEDTSLYLDALGGLPGPLIKWFLKAQGTAGVAELAHKMGNSKATGRTIIGYAKSPEEIHFFAGEVHGTVVLPRGENGFGWDPIFQPEGDNKTFAEMTLDEKQHYSMRAQAAQKLKDFLSRT